MKISKHHNEAIVTTDGLSHRETGETGQRQRSRRNQAGVLTPLLGFRAPADLSCGVLLCGIKNRNRATHGDTVAVELLPRNEWRGRVAALAEGHGVESESKILPTGQRLGVASPACACSELTSDSTGRVVGILQRNWRDYVVTFPPRDGSQSQSRSSKHILAVPWDRRIPKIRVSTQQAEALQVRLRPASSDSATAP